MTHPDPTPVDRTAASLARQVTRAIHDKTPPRTQSDDYRLGWEEALDAAIDAARDVVAAAVPTPPAVRDGLRDRIAEALLDYLSRTADIRTGRTGELAFMPEITDAEQLRIADAVLAVLPPTNQRAAVLLWAADRYETILASATAEHSSDPRYYTGVRDVILGLRRLAGEAQQQPTTETPQPDTDACRSVDVDGEPVLVRGRGDFTEQDTEVFGEIVRAAKRKYEVEQRTDRRRGSTLNLLARLDHHWTLSSKERAMLRQHIEAEAREADTARATIERVQQVCHDLPYEHARRILAALDGAEQAATEA
jgi:hypothetical protein